MSKIHEMTFDHASTKSGEDLQYMGDDSVQFVVKQGRLATSVRSIKSCELTCFGIVVFDVDRWARFS
jgi:hypothetical protein